MAPNVSISSPSQTANTTSVQVAVRIRPTNPHDAATIPQRFQRTAIHPLSATTVSVDNVPLTAQGLAATSSASPSAPKKSTFSFDQVHPPNTSQYELYNGTAAPLVTRFLEGFNCTVLAYGQTSSGKTYSMTGVDLDADPSDPDNGMGIIPRAVSTIFSRGNEIKRERRNAWQYSIKASFIEIYNEDLIDLLGVDDSAGARREVQIREDKDGTIIWGGLREVPVRNAADVMAILKQGSSLRRTNETDMNAQSSRSHAIFSLTMTQKKFSGSHPPPVGRSSPMPPTPSPSRLARPGSMYTTTRVSSPTFGRAPTPSFTAAMNRASSSSLRPSSAMGMRSGSPEGDDDKGEWITVVSKFHFVDLAGSERLKRTAAVGDRIKEGISINGGLLALGNVISALGDPSRARTLGQGTNIHVPYRDSKLTRLLQDSLGGNAHTLMIACVSPAEWNLSETVNTLKYANRARNIRNRAEIKEKEEGWDDIDWLQNMVNKLRKELKALKEGSAGSAATSTHGGDEDDNERALQPPSASAPPPDRAGGKVLKQYAELQDVYLDLRTQYVERNEELARLRKELEEQHVPSGGRKYEEIVGPVIEEYEKTIAAMEAELKLSRTALEHTNEMYAEQENELNVIKERNENADAYIEVLRARVAKLAERESSTEGYIRDLEVKLKSFSDTSISSTDSVADLRKEIAHYKESEANSATYILNIEQRLSTRDADILELRAHVENLEADLEQRTAELANLQSRLDAILREREDMDNWKSVLDEREKKVQALELKMEEWEKVRKEAALERERLGNVVGDVESARQSLRVPAGSEGSSPLSASPSLPSPSGESAAIPDTPLEISAAQREEYLALQATHSETLAELNTVSTKYRDALREITDLAAQIAEVKLQTSDTASDDLGSDAGSVGRVPKTPTSTGRRRQLGRNMSESGFGAGFGSPNGPPMIGTPTSARLSFFRHAASAEGLRSRSQSQSLSQELYSAPSPRSSWGAAGFIGDSLLSPGTQAGSRLSIKVPENQQRSVESLEKEIMRLQEVLKDRESEIGHLEESLKQSPISIHPSPLNGVRRELPGVAEEGEMLHLSDSLRRDDDLTPGTQTKFEELKKSMSLHDEQADEERKEAESLGRLNELMRSMAQKESQHATAVESLNEQLETATKQHEEFATISRDQAATMSMQVMTMTAEMEVMRKDLGQANEQHEALAQELKQLRSNESDLRRAMQEADDAHAKDVEALRSQYAAETEKHQGELALIQEQHQAELVRLAAVRSELEKSHRDAIEQHISTHESEMSQAAEQYVEASASLRSVHEADLEVKLAAAAEAGIAAKAAHEKVLAAVKLEYEETIRKQIEDSSTAMERLREDHAVALQRETIAREGATTDRQSRQAFAIQELQGSHESALERKEAQHKEDLEKVSTEHARLLAIRDNEHGSNMDRLSAEHSRKEAESTSLLETAQSEHAREIAAVQAMHTASLEALQREHAEEIDLSEASKADEIDRISQALVKSQEEHQVAVSGFQDVLQASLADADAQHKAELDQKSAEHQKALAHLKAEHQETIGELQVMLSSLRDEHTHAVMDLRREHDSFTEEERRIFDSNIAELEKTHSEKSETLLKARDALESEVASLQVSVREHEASINKLTAAHAVTLKEKEDAILNLEHELTLVREECETFAVTIEELERTIGERSAHVEDTSNRDSLLQELEHHRSALGDTQSDLQRTKDEMDTLRTEKSRQDQVLRDLQAQLSAAASQKLSGDAPLVPLPPIPGERTISTSRANGATKLPPLTPPPSIPPPPVPGSIPPVPPLSTDHSVSTNSRTSTGSQDSMESSGSGRSTPSTSILASPTSTDPKLHTQTIDQARHIEEQEAMIKTLNKQLSHCESDLQAHMDLVVTLETSLTDSERNLRKTRSQANEHVKERDSLNAQIDALRAQLQQSQQEIQNARRSVVEEKQNYEARLEEERRAKERTRAQLDSRMEELQKRKSKFACL